MVDEGRLDEARQAHVRLREAQAAFRDAETSFHEAVRRLHESGVSAGEVGVALQLSPLATRRILGLEEAGDLLHCTFCGQSQHEVRKLIAGPGVYICNGCIDGAAITDGAQDERCSFCGKSRAQVAGLAAGPDVHICAECLELCREIVAEEGLD